MNNAGRVNTALEALTLAVIDNASIAMLIAETSSIAWDIIAPKPGADEKSFREREPLPAYKGIREGLVMAT